MTTLTIQIDELTLSRVEAKVQQRGTTVGDLLREYLDRLAEDHASATEEVAQSLLMLSRATRSGSGGRRWTVTSSMSADKGLFRLFLDTNVLVYVFDDDSPSKQRRARELLAASGRTVQPVISTQVLQEFYVTTTPKLTRPLSETAVFLQLAGRLLHGKVPLAG